MEGEILELEVTADTAGLSKTRTFCYPAIAQPENLVHMMDWRPLDDIPDQLELAGPVVQQVDCEIRYDAPEGSDGAGMDGTEGHFQLSAEEAKVISTLDVYQAMALAWAWDGGGGKITAKIRFLDRYGHDVQRIGEDAFTQSRAA